MPPQTFCAHFSRASNDAHLNLPHTRNSSLWVSAVAVVTTTLKMPIFVQFVQNFIVSRFYRLCAHFSHASHVLQLSLPHNDCFGFRHLPLLSGCMIIKLKKIFFLYLTYLHNLHVNIVFAISQIYFIGFSNFFLNVQKAERYVSENDEIKVTTTTNNCQTYGEEVGNLLLTATS